MKKDISKNNISKTNHTITVLLIDDQKFNEKAVKQILKDERDIDFHYCMHSHMAIRYVNKILPTIILQDLTMPDINGLQLVQLYRINKNVQKVPLIVLSATEDADIKAKAFAVGANDYMVKFPDKQEFIARIRYHSLSYIHRLQRDEAFEEIKRQSKELEIRNRFIKKTFGRYLSDDIVNSILDSPDGLELGGEQRKVTIMMTDIRGFTSLSERLKPDDVVKILNIYFKHMTNIIFEYRGTIDEFIGDAILALFGAPISEPEDTERAIACALKMQIAMEKVNMEIMALNYPEISMGIGINTGNVIAGNIGSEKRSKYAVIGKNVNLTARIESYTIGGQILLSEYTIKSCKCELRINDKMKVSPKGVQNEIEIYDVGGIGKPFNVYLPVKQDANMIDLNKQIKIYYQIIEGKNTDKEEYSAMIISLSRKVMKLHIKNNVERFSNIKIKLFDEIHDIKIENIYAKIIKIISDTEILINLTSKPPEIEKFFNTYL